MQQVKKIVIVVRTSEEGADDMAIDEAMRRIKAGNLSGSDRNESSAFYFDVTDQVPDNELPAGGDDDSEAPPSRPFELILDDARKAFWAAIARAYPTISSGDFPAEAELAFEDACKTAVRTWLDANLSTGAVIRAEDGYRLERQADGTFTDGDLTFGTLEEMGVDFVVQQGQ
ncbi:MAG: hypothetical protein AzoDbin1_01854 [Azoarcus sp.]|nr:hypothetical protein [Azoarcus sp.]